MMDKPVISEYEKKMHTTSEALVMCTCADTHADDIPKNTFFIFKRAENV